MCHRRPGRRRGPTPVRSHSHARPCSHAALAQTCTPALARPRREGEAGPLAPFFLRRTSPRRCAPVDRAALALPWRLASCTRSQRRERRPFWSTSAHLATGRHSHTHASVPDCGYLVRRHPLAPARAPPWSSPPRHFAANSGPKPEPLTPLHPCAPKRTHTHARSRASSPEWALRPRYHVPPPRRRCRADHGVDLAAPVASFLGRFLQTLATRGDRVNLAREHVA
jgi:hypothetical protein